MDPYTSATFVTSDGQIGETHPGNMIWSDFDSRILRLIFILEALVAIPSLVVYASYLYFFNEDFFAQGIEPWLYILQVAMNILYYCLPALGGLGSVILVRLDFRFSVLLFLIVNAYAIIIAVPELIWSILFIISSEVSLIEAIALVLSAGRLMYALLLLGLWQHFRLNYNSAKATP